MASTESVGGPLESGGDATFAPGLLTPPRGAAVVEPGRRRYAHARASARAFLSRTQALGPALVVAMVLGLAIGPGLVVFRGNPTGFVRFGREFVAKTHPPAGAVVERRTGYDGQFFWVLAQDPLVIHPNTIAAFRGQGFRLARLGYPALAYVLAGGQADAVPWSLIAVNVIAVIALTLAFAAYARRRGWSGWWALAVGLLPGLQFITMGDLSGAVAVAFMLGGLMAWERRRRWSAAWLLAAAGLTREPMLLAVVAVAVEGGVQWWPVRRSPAALRSSLQAAWPVLAVPAAVFLCWQTYVHMRIGGSTLPPGSAFELPLLGLLGQVPVALRGGLTLTAIWDLAYLVATFAGIAAALTLVRRTTSAPAVAAALFGVVLLVLPFGSDWGYTRESAPLFAALLLAGLGRPMRPMRPAITVCRYVAVLGLLVPLMVG